MPGSAERVGSPAPQVTDRATENETRCPTRPGADSLNPCPLPTPRPAQDAQSIPPAPSSSQRTLGSHNYRAQQAPRATPACAGATVGGDRTTGRKAAPWSRRGAETAEGSRLPYGCDPSPPSDIKRSAASHEPPPRPQRLCAQTRWLPSQKKPFRPPSPDDDVSSTSSTSAREFQQFRLVRPTRITCPRTRCRFGIATAPDRS